MDTGQAFLTLEATATIFMAGVLWTMRLLNYPLLALVGNDAFPAMRLRTTAASHWWSSRGCWPRRPAASASCCPAPSQVPLWAPACELALLLVVIISTAALQGRQHGALAGSFDQRTLGLLVRSFAPTGIRVGAWSAAGATALWMCHQAFMP